MKGFITPVYTWIVLLSALWMSPNVKAIDLSYNQYSDTLDLSFFAVIVSDMDQARTWYQDCLKARIVDQYDHPEGRFRQVNLSLERVNIELIELKNSLSQEKALKSSGRQNSRIQGLFKMGFSTPNFDQWLINFERCGTEMQDEVLTDPVSGKRMTMVFDPDHNRIQIFEYKDIDK